MKIHSMPTNDAYRSNYDRIFRPCSKDKCDVCAPEEGDKAMVASLCGVCGKVGPHPCNNCLLDIVCP